MFDFRSVGGRPLALAAFAAVTLISHTGFSADDLEALLSKGNESFAKREAVDDDKAVLQTISTLADVASMPATDDASKVVKYRALCLLSRAYYFAGSIKPLTQKAPRIALLEKGMAAAKAALTISDKHTDAYYYYAINLSRWGITKGVGEVLGRRGELNDNLRLAISRKTIDGAEGQTIDGYGPLRVRGRAAYKLPPALGRDDARSLADLRIAAEKAPYVASNVIFYSAILARKRAKDKDGNTATQVLARVIGTAKSAESAAEDFIASFEGTPFAADAKSRTAETKKDFKEDLEETAGELRLKLPW